MTSASEEGKKLRVKAEQQEKLLGMLLPCKSEMERLKEIVEQE